MKHCLFLGVFLLNMSALFAQTRLKGLVIDSESNKPVPYVSIGIISKADGTVSNINGEFELALDAAITDDDTLRFSSIGYQTKDFVVSELRKKYSSSLLTVSLKKSVKELNQVVIKGRHAEIKILGYQTTSKLLGLGFGTNSIGSQGGVRLAVKHPNTNLESLSFFIIQNSFESLAFRVNIYEMVDGKPGNNILNENIIVKIGDKQSGNITVDLSSYNIYVSKDVLITLEWIDARPATSGTLDVAAVVFGSTYFRQASQYFWRKKGTGLGISVKANY